MAYTTRQLITRSFYLSNVVARDAQVLSGSQLQTGLDLLNALLDYKQVDTDLIPYWEYDVSITTVPNQESYFIPNCVAIESMTFNLQSIRFPMEPASRTAYFATARVDNISSLPYSWYFNRSLGGGTLYMYFLPEGEYQLKIMAKFALTEVTIDEDLTTVYDTSYIEYLRYALAEYICSDYGIEFNPLSKKLMDKIERELMYISPPDLSMQKASILMNANSLNIADCNIGHLWRP